MRVDKNDTIAGRPIKEVRDMLRRLRRINVTADWFEGFEVAALLAADLIEPDDLEPFDKSQYYRLSDLGTRLASAHFTRRISRAKAEQFVADLLLRVKAINANRALGYRVHEIRVFGSYLADCSDLGDIDLAVAWEARPRRGEDLVQMNHRRADASGRELNFYARLVFAQTEVRQLLKGRNPYLSMHTIEELETLNTPWRQLYPPPGTKQ